METQASFDFTAPPAPPTGEVDRLVHHLRNNPGFHTASQISSSLGFSDRKIRQLAELSDGLIISGPGSPGYCHLHHCPTETLSHIISTLRSHARSMIARSIRIRRRAHAIIH
ncbi:MAG: hypothetical protein WCS43_15925 [Verrucomicrobiota bacterium]